MKLGNLLSELVTKDSLKPQFMFNGLIVPSIIICVKTTTTSTVNLDL